MAIFMGARGLMNIMLNRVESVSGWLNLEGSLKKLEILTGELSQWE